LSTWWSSSRSFDRQAQIDPSTHSKTEKGKARRCLTADEVSLSATERAQVRIAEQPPVHWVVHNAAVGKLSAVAVRFRRQRSSRVAVSAADAPLGSYWGASNAPMEAAGERQAAHVQTTPENV
jgi:hypothetical protein